jgi:3-dehydroquinate dehydratase-2
MKIQVINGPNLNMLGERESQFYGSLTLAELESRVRDAFPQVDFDFYQSNHEGELIDRIHSLVRDASVQGLIINAGAFTHTSLALRYALAIWNVPKIEVHLSNIHARESFRHTSLTGGVCQGIIAGLGLNSYLLGVRAVIDLIDAAR